MSTTNAVTGTTGTTTTTSSTSGISGTTAQELQDRFMTLFMAQIKNQDPLKPMDNADMTSQLAQMNMLNGIEGLNSTMKTLLGAYNDSLSLQASNLIGKQVLVPGTQLALGSSGAIGGVTLAADADKVTVVISDATGKPVATETLGAQKAGNVAFTWDGVGSDGKALPAGTYKIAVQATSAGKSVEATALQLGTVSALTRGSSGFQVEVAGVGDFELNDVKQVF
ncbi:MAG: hypothetical protein RIR00_1181 [Pseudomonadota bacterium]|jgi:flagellar basal-body rod modification protein FlgD